MKKTNRLKYIMLWIGLPILLLITIVGATCVGSADIGFGEAMRLLLAKIPGIRNGISLDDVKKTHSVIVYQVRFPRVCLSGLVGAGLAVTGAAFQGLFRNPLADPHILGVSSGAALGATVGMLTGVGVKMAGLSVIGTFAFAGGLLTVFVVYRIAGRAGSRNTVYLLLTGTAISSFLSAVISFLMSRNRETLEKVYLWTLGSFSAASMEKIRFMLLVLFVTGVVLFVMGRELDLLATGTESAATMGVSLKFTNGVIVFAGTVLVAACVSVSGVIGFAGLIIPHCIRLIAGPSHRRLIPYAMFAGAVFMIVCDTLARTLTAPSEIPVGVVTAMFGAPYFLFLLCRQKRKV